MLASVPCIGVGLSKFSTRIQFLTVWPKPMEQSPQWSLTVVSARTGEEALNFRSWTRRDVLAGTPPLEAWASVERCSGSRNMRSTLLGRGFRSLVFRAMSTN